MTKEEARQQFFTRVPKARKGNPMFEGLFEFIWDAGQLARPGTRVLNIFSSADLSGKREEVYKNVFFKEAHMTEIDFWKDSFIYDGTTYETRHKLPYKDASFDVVVTTKVIMEHVSEPSDVMGEIQRVLKPGGEAFIIAPHIRRQHQKPYDYFRFTESALEYLAKKNGFSSWKVHTNDGYFYTMAAHGYFFQRSLPMPKFLEKTLDLFNHYVREPIAFSLHKLDNGYGKDFASYFFLRARK